jgi:hypothetical protein
MDRRGRHRPIGAEVVANRAGAESAVADDNCDEGPRTWCRLDQRCDERDVGEGAAACRRPAPSCPCVEGAERPSLHPQGRPCVRPPAALGPATTRRSPETGLTLQLSRLTPTAPKLACAGQAAAKGCHQALAITGRLPSVPFVTYV